MLLAFYGDDFTGSTDALEVLTRAGARSVLFIAPPTPERLAEYPGLQAMGIAGRSRSLSPAAMETELRPAFLALHQSGARHVHYKVCSTFDSSPAIGNIGRALEIGAEIFRSRFVPVVVGAPSLGRYCLFGNLFARMGIGSNGAIYRLDRHPSMSRHPITPAHESDLRLHLAQQTSKRMGLVDILALDQGDAAAQAALDTAVAGGAEVIFIDLLSAEQLPRIGALLDRAAGQSTAEQSATRWSAGSLPPEALAKEGGRAELSQPTPLFSVGSSGIEMALVAHAAAQGRLHPVTRWPDPGVAEPLLVGSGSCSPVTEAQITRALDNGFAEVVLDTAGLADPSRAAATEQVSITEVLGHLRAKRSVIVHTSRGSSDPRLAPTAAALAKTGQSSASAEVLGRGLGRVLRGALAQCLVRRLIIAGGDTSSYVGRGLGIEAAEMIAPLVPGAPLCRVRAPGSPADGLQVAFKGGQVGSVDFFLTATRGA
jgi:uncharacterized protein YgbK (DUF1537 family)